MTGRARLIGTGESDLPYGAPWMPVILHRSTTRSKIVPDPQEGGEFGNARLVKSIVLEGDQGSDGWWIFPGRVGKAGAYFEPRPAARKFYHQGSHPAFVTPFSG